MQLQRLPTALVQPSDGPWGQVGLVDEVCLGMGRDGMGIFSSTAQQYGQ